MASSHVQTVLREITDTTNGRAHLLFVRMTLPRITVTVLAPPAGSGGGGGGWVRSFKGELSVAMQPQSLSSATRATWMPRVSQALLGHEGQEKYSFSIAESTAAAADHEAAGSASGGRRKTTQSQRRFELKVSYRDATLVRLPLSSLARDSASLAAVGAVAGSPFGAYRTDSIHLLERVAQFTTELQSKNKAREDQKRFGEAKLTALLDQIQTKAMQKTWMEEGVLAQLNALLHTKDAEIKRLRDEREALSGEIATLQLRSQLGGMGDSASSLTEHDIARMAVVVDDEERQARRDAHSDSEDERDEDDGTGSESAAPPAAAAAAKPARGGRKASAKPAAAAARKPRAKAPAKPRGKKAAAAAAAASASDSDMADSKPPAAAAGVSKKRTRKRIRSPSPISEEDSAEEAWSAHEEEGENDAVAAVAAYERATARSAAKAASASAAKPAAAAVVGASAPRRTRSGGRLPTPHASPLPASHHDSSSPSQLLAFDGGQDQARKRAVSPPPRVLPKRSLAQILRDGAAGLEEPDEDEEEPSASASSVARPATHVASPPAAAASLPSGVAPMDMSSQ